MIKYGLVLVLIVTLFGAQAQTFTTQQDGPWNDPATWDQGAIPDAATSDAIIINNNVNIPSGYSVTIDATTVNAGAILTVNTGGTLTLAGVVDALVVDGTVVAENTSTIAGSNGTNIRFNDGLYQHGFTTTQGVIPQAVWGSNSTTEIIGYTTFTTTSAAGNWTQSFNRFIWNCTNQTATVDMAGRLTTIAANFEVQSTGTGFLQLSTTQNPTITIGGDLQISGTSRVTFSTAGASPGAIINITNDLVFSSTNPTTGTRLVTGAVGVCTINVGRDFLMDASGGLFNMTSGNNGSATLNITGNLDLTNGTLTETGGGTSTAFVNFVNSGTEHTFNNTGTIANRFSYTVATGNTLRLLGESQMVGAASSTLTVSGTGILILESTASNGAIQTGSGILAGGGNIRVVTRTFDASSTVIYGASSAQFLGNGNSGTGGTTIGTVVIDNASGASAVAGTIVTINGNLRLQTGNLAVSNASLAVTGAVDLEGGNLNFTSVGTARTLTISGAIALNGGDINVVSGTANATVTLNGTLSGSNFISFSGANSNLTIGGAGGLGIDFPLPGATTLEVLTINRTGNPTIVFNEDLTLGSAGVTDCVVLTNGNVDMNGTVTATRRISLATGTVFHFEDQTLNLQLGFNSTGGTLSSNSNSTMNVTGTGVLGTLVFDASGNTLGTFTLNRPTGGTVVTLNSPLTVTSTFTLTDGDFLNTSGLSFASGANVTRNVLASFVGTSAVPGGGPYNLFYTGTSLTTGVEARGSLNDITTNCSGIVTLGSAVAGVGTLNVNTGTFTCVGNTLSIGNILNTTTFTASTATVTLSGDLTNNGTFNRNNGTVIFAGNSSILGANANTMLFQNITISGTLTAPTTLNVFGNFTNNGTFTEGTGTVVFQGGTLKSISGSTTTNFYNISILNGASTPDLEVLGSANLRNVLTLAANVQFDADGSTGAGVFTILSTGDNPTVDGAIATLPASASVTGNLTVQRYMSGEGRIYRYISSPVSGASIASWQDDFTITGTFSDPSTSGPICGFPVTSASPSLYYYDETQAVSGSTDNGWIAYPTTGTAASNPLVVGRGYSPYIRECTNPTVVDVTGTANQGNVDVILNYTNNGDLTLDGYNLVGNPYPSAINWQAAGWVRSATNISPVIAVRDNGSGGTFTYYDYTDGSATDYIATGQAFWVRATVNNQTLGFREATKVSASTIFYRTAADDALAITLTRGAITDKAILKLNPEARATLDIFDGPKLNNGSFDLSTLSQESIAMAINAVDKITCGVEVPLNFKFYTNPNGTYTMNFDPSGLFAGFQITLVDTYANKSVNVSQNPSYQYIVDNTAGSRASGRFKLIFEQQNPVVLDLAVSDAKICNEDVAQITIEDTQPGVLYTAQLGDATVSDTIEGDGFDHMLTIAADKLSAADNTVHIKANGQCSTQHLTETALIQKEGLISTSVLSGSHCREGSVTLKVSDPVDGVTYRWYTSAASTEVLAEGIEFTTPTLEESHEYVVAAVNRLGCEGEKTTAKAEIITFDDAVITKVEDGIIQSNFESGNQWYHNGEMIIGAVSQELVVTESGVYKVEVKVSSCTTSAEFNYVIMGAEGNANASIQAYPNPVTDELIVKFKNPQDVQTTVLIDNLGKSLEVKSKSQVRDGKVIFVMNNYPAGVYVVKVQGSTYLSMLKVIKK